MKSHFLAAAVFEQLGWLGQRWGHSASAAGHLEKTMQKQVLPCPHMPKKVIKEADLN